MSDKVLFLMPDGSVHDDRMVCSGRLPAELAGANCSYSSQGYFPGLTNLESDSDKGQRGDLCPLCAKSQLGSLGHWDAERKLYHPDLHPLRLFKCRMGFWLVLPDVID